MVKKKAAKPKGPKKTKLEPMAKPKVKQPRLFKQSKADEMLEEAAQALFEAQNEFSAAGKKKKAAESILVERMKKHGRRVMQVGDFTISAIPETKIKVVKASDDDDEEEGHEKKKTGHKYGGEEDESAKVKDSKEKKDPADINPRDLDSSCDAPEPEPAGAAADVPAP